MDSSTQATLFTRIRVFIGTTWNHSGFQKYLKNTSWMFAGRVATMGISFLATLYIARNLGPTNFGQLSYALSVIGLIGFVAPLGLDGILYRELIKRPEERKVLLGTAFLLRFIAGSITTILAIATTLFISTDDVSRILIAILAGTFLLNPFQLINYAFLAKTNSKYQAIISTFVTIILNVLKILVIVFGEGIIYIALVLLLEQVLYALAYVFLYYQKTGEKLHEWKWSTPAAKALLKDSLPIVLLSAFTLVYARIDQVFIKHFLGATEVGLYDAAVRLVDVWNFIPGIIATALFPAIVNAHTASSTLFSSRIKKISIFFIVLPALIALTITLLASFIVNILYGVAFAGTIPVLQVYIWSTIGTSLGILVQTYFTVRNERILLILSSFIPMLINVGLNILWIPQYGIIGSAYATLVSYSLVPLFFLFKRKTS